MELRESLNKDDFKKLVLPFPDFDTQTAIVSFLDRKTSQIDKAITIKEKQIELLKERRQILIYNAITRGLNPKIEMKNSGENSLGEVPINWKVTKLGLYVEILSGYAFPSSTFSKEPGIKLLRGINISIENVKWEDLAYWPESKMQNLKNYLLEENDIVVGMDRPLIAGGMRVATIKRDDLPCLLLQRVTRIRAINGLLQEYLMLIFMSKSFEHYFLPILSGVSVPHLSPNQIQSFKIAIPDLETQRKILRHIEIQSSKIRATIYLKEKEIEKLKEYKATLINSAVTGKIKVG